jgi:hypothetical protein
MRKRIREKPDEIRRAVETKVPIVIRGMGLE